jgi:hypothetical protein
MSRNDKGPAGSGGPFVACVSWGYFTMRNILKLFLPAEREP